MTTAILVIGGVVAIFGVAILYVILTEKPSSYWESERKGLDEEFPPWS